MIRVLRSTQDKVFEFSMKKLINSPDNCKTLDTNIREIMRSKKHGGRRVYVYCQVAKNKIVGNTMDLHSFGPPKTILSTFKVTKVNEYARLLYS